MACAESETQAFLESLCGGLGNEAEPPPPAVPNADVPHAPKRPVPLTQGQVEMAISNALRYVPTRWQAVLKDDFASELRTYGHIYAFRFLPAAVNASPGLMRAYPIHLYPAQCQQAAALMLMIMNNLDPRVAQFPLHLVTYGGNGQVFSNWLQFRLTMRYLSQMGEDQTLSLYSGHPLGLFPSQPDAPRAVVTNGMVIPNYSSKADYDRMFALGVSQYGQMTAGSFCYIGPQGIVHGTTITVLNAGRKYLGLEDLAGKVLLTSGLGGMSGAQAKAAVIAGCVGVIAEMDPAVLHKRHEQGWLDEWTDSLPELLERLKRARKEAKPLSLGYLGNVVEVWEALAAEVAGGGELLAELGSDQTSCHNVFGGGYFPVGYSKEEAEALMTSDPAKFRSEVQATLRRHIAAIDALASRGLFFWDYGNAFLLECDRAGADVRNADDPSATRFKYPSYVQDIMGDIFSMGFGPFRWVCASGRPEDLAETDRIAADVIQGILQSPATPAYAQQQLKDNLKWVREAGAAQLVVGSQARILYADEEGRSALAAAFNAAIREGRISGPVVLSRDHHDVSGTDSPFRETSNVYDGSAFTADMAVQNFVGDAFRGATWVALHNGGGVGWGDVVNGGFGLLLDGSSGAGRRASAMLAWDVSNGVARRSWSGHPLARQAIARAMHRQPRLRVTLPEPPPE